MINDDITGKRTGLQKLTLKIKQRRLRWLVAKYADCVTSSFMYASEPHEMTVTVT